MSDVLRGCNLGYEEHDGFRYCFAHGGFRNPGSPKPWCDRAPAPSAWVSDTAADQPKSGVADARFGASA